MPAARSCAVIASTSRTRKLTIHICLESPKYVLGSGDGLNAVGPACWYQGAADLRGARPQDVPDTTAPALPSHERRRTTRQCPSPFPFLVLSHFPCAPLYHSVGLGVFR